MQIDIKKLTEETVKHMDAQGHDDVPWSVGMVLLDLYYAECVREVQAQMVEKFHNQRKAKENV